MRAPRRRRSPLTCARPGPRRLPRWLPRLPPPGPPGSRSRPRPRPRLRPRPAPLPMTAAPAPASAPPAPPAGTIQANTSTNPAAYPSIQHVEVVNTTGLVVRGNTMSGVGLGVPVSHGYEGTWGNSIYVFNSSGYLIENNTIGVNYWSAI